MSTQRRGFLKLVGRNFENKKLVRRRQDMVSIQKLVTFFFFLFLLLFSFFFSPHSMLMFFMLVPFIQRNPSRSDSFNEPITESLNRFD